MRLDNELFSTPNQQLLISGIQQHWLTGTNDVGMKFLHPILGNGNSII